MQFRGEEIYSFNNEVGFEGVGHGTIERSFCVECGPDTVGIRVSSDTRGILHTFGDDDHIVTAFRRARFSTEITEDAQSAAGLLAATANNPVCPPGPTPGRRVAAQPVGWLVEEATGASINLQSLSSSGVAEALNWDRDLIMLLARLSNESSSVWTPSGRAVLPNGPVVSDDQLADLNTRLQSMTGLALAARTKSTAVPLW